MIHIVLVEPEIPQNTGNIARTCACSGTALHLVGKLGFDTDEKAVRRAGLDYWDKLDIFYYKDLDEFMKLHEGKTKYYCSTKAKKLYTEVDYNSKNSTGEGCCDIFLLFGKETKGLPEKLIFDNYENAIKIPMQSGIRSLNLSNAVAIILYEALRQTGFYGLIENEKC